MGALREPRFRRLLVGWSLSNFGDSALYLSLAIWAKDLTGSNAAAGLIFFALAVPVFLSPLGGHLADRVRRRPLLVGTNLVGAVMVLALLAVSSVADLWILYAVAFGYGLLGTVIGSAQSGLLRDLLPDEDLAVANSALSTIDQGLRILSPLVGAGIYAAYGGGRWPSSPVRRSWPPPSRCSRSGSPSPIRMSIRGSTSAASSPPVSGMCGPRRHCCASCWPSRWPSP